MNLEKTFQEIESYEFAAYLGVTSNLNVFLRVGFQQDVVRILLTALTSHERLTKVIHHIYKLSRKPIDEGYENPLDTALAIYTSCLFDKFRSGEICGRNGLTSTTDLVGIEGSTSSFTRMSIRKQIRIR